MAKPQPSASDGTGRKKPIWADRPTFGSRLFFVDVDPLVWWGYKSRLEPEDMNHNAAVETAQLHQTFERVWRARAHVVDKPLCYCFSTEHRRIVPALLAGNWSLVIGSGLLYAISQATTLAGPLLLRRIVDGLSCQAVHAPNCESKSQLYYYVIGLFLAPFIQSLCENHYMFILMVLGTKMRNTLMAAIYRKCLRLNNAAMLTESTGKVVTLMSNDAQKLQDAMFAMHAMWGSPLYIAAILALLAQQVGWATAVGVGVMLALVPITGTLAAKLAALRLALVKWTDKRVGYMNELISGIQMIKFYAWENSFRESVMGARAQEAAILKRMVLWQGLFGLILFAGPIAVALFTFASYTVAGGTLSTARAYAALSLFTLLRFPMSFLPMLITMVVNAFVSMKRIAQFLVKPEVPEPKELYTPLSEAGRVEIKDGNFSWAEEQEKPTLRDINLNVAPGKLAMIVGTVGSGKSSILASLLGHIIRRSGSIALGGKMAYVPQTAWIVNDTLQSNVLMGEPMDATKYEMALTVSQLGPDLEILPNGDQTEIGDRGITLSGGQKQRVSIARAVYADADIYLMDDPLSAVDSHVGRALFEYCIKGVLKNKTILLVTNALQYLPQSDVVIWVEAGTIRGQGSYEELVTAGLNVAELVHMEAEDEEAIEAKKKVEGTKKQAPLHLVTQATEKDSKNLTGVETREEGQLSGHVVGMYVAAGGGMLIILLLLGMFTLEQVVRVYTDYWVGAWFSDQFHQSSMWFYIGIYAGLGVLYSIIVYLRSLRFLWTCVNAAVSLHNQLLNSILHLPKTFFDTNPSGRILNRFSRDTEIMDNVLSQDLIQLAGAFATFIAILIVICIATKWFAIALVPITIVYIMLQRYYIPSARELQRIESITRSPIYSRFAEALLGMVTIRAFAKDGYFVALSDRLMRENAEAYLTQKLASSWLAMRLDALGIIIVTLAGVLCIQGSISPALAGLCLVYALDLTRFLKHGTAMAAKVESDFTSVERVGQYLTQTPEAAAETSPKQLALMPKDWPEKGALALEDVTMRYRPETPLVLKGVSFSVAAGKKVGIVGRTGSGKSSLLLVIFRMVEPSSGRILIDGVDVQSVGLEHLRSVMSIIPQDPFMFSGSVRKNLDPFAVHSDVELWEVLEAVNLLKTVGGLEGKLEAPVSDNGANFSQGQRQLVCMARAMLRKSRLLMLDEATASIDPESDTAIQIAIRRHFTTSTMLIIAHRLNTIMDADAAIVMEDGLVAESGEPNELLKDGKGLLSAFVAQTGGRSAAYLRDMARTATVARSKSAADLAESDSQRNDLPDERVDSFTSATSRASRLEEGSKPATAKEGASSEEVAKEAGTVAKEDEPKQGDKDEVPGEEARGVEGKAEAAAKRGPGDGDDRV